MGSEGTVSALKERPVKPPIARIQHPQLNPGGIVEVDGVVRFCSIRESGHNATSVVFIFHCLVSFLVSWQLKFHLLKLRISHCQSKFS